MREHHEALAQLAAELADGIDLPQVSKADLEAAAARMAIALRRIRAEPQPDQIWEGGETP